MKPEHKAILSIIEQYLKDNPSIRFCQALFNLNINMFQNERDPALAGNLLRDPYNDTDKQVLERMKSE